MVPVIRLNSQPLAHTQALNGEKAFRQRKLLRQHGLLVPHAGTRGVHVVDQQGQCAVGGWRVALILLHDGGQRVEQEVRLDLRAQPQQFGVGAIGFQCQQADACAMQLLLNGGVVSPPIHGVHDPGGPQCVAEQVLGNYRQG